MIITSRAKNGQRDCSGRFEEPSSRRPVQELGGAVDLIVMFAARKGEQLKQEAVEPFGVPRQVDMSGFNLGGLRRHAVSLAALRVVADWTVHARWRIALQVLQQRRSGFLDQDGVGAVLRTLMKGRGQCFRLIGG
jgi:hypothetical protein